MDPGDIAAATINPPAVEEVDDVLENSDAASDHYESDLDFEDEAQAQWERSIEEIERTIFLVLCPVIGRVLGRRIAQNLWITYVTSRYKSSHPLQLSS